jgi:SAM-dependent methyltransferase
MERWYYQIELPDGTFTNGQPRENFALCRQFFPRIEKAGLRCLDIGSQDFAGPVLFRRQGAGEVVAYDRLRLESRRRVVADAYNVDFRYAAGIPLHGLKRHLRDEGVGTVFDYVNFCGVMYHMIDPLPGLGMARSFLRAGGILLLETTFAPDPEFVIRVNHAGDLYDTSTYFHPSLGVLDYWIRMLRMKILDAAFTGPWKGVVGRVVAVCRAVDQPVADAADVWIRKPWVEKDFEPFGLNYKELASDAPPVAYRGGTGKVVVRPGLDSVDLYETFRRYGATGFDHSLSVLRLKDVA